MLTPTGAATSMGYRFGVNVEIVEGIGVIHHGGAINGFAAMLIYVPGPDVSVAGKAIGPQELAKELALVALMAP